MPRANGNHCGFHQAASAATVASTPATTDPTPRAPGGSKFKAPAHLLNLVQRLAPHLRLIQRGASGMHAAQSTVTVPVDNTRPPTSPPARDDLLRHGWYAASDKDAAVVTAGGGVYLGILRNFLLEVGEMVGCDKPELYFMGYSDAGVLIRLDKHVDCPGQGVGMRWTLTPFSWSDGRLRCALRLLCHIHVPPVNSASLSCRYTLQDENHRHIRGSDNVEWDCEDMITSFDNAQCGQVPIVKTAVGNALHQLHQVEIAPGSPPRLACVMTFPGAEQHLVQHLVHRLAAGQVLWL